MVMPKKINYFSHRRRFQIDNGYRGQPFFRNRIDNRRPQLYFGFTALAVVIWSPIDLRWQTAIVLGEKSGE
jgi:hypothetical protein